MCTPILLSTASPFPPDGGEEVGDGRRLDGAVGGDIPGEEKPLHGYDVERSDGVDAWRPPVLNGSPGPRSAPLDKIVVVG